MIRKSPMKRGGRIKPVNRKRRQSEFARCYHSRERVAFVKALPCLVCRRGPCDNAHIETGGMGRKADYTKIVPLCSMGADDPFGPGYPKGHHGFFHQIGRESFVTCYPKLALDLEAAAAETERLWQGHTQTEQDNDAA